MMFRAFRCLPAAIVFVLANGFALAAEVQIESEAFRGADDRRLAIAAAQFIRASGYRCDSVSGAIRALGTDPYTLKCNRFSLTYQIKINDREGLQAR
ncbi:hypothetical protein GCM10028812_24420 [Ancylobacter sonchi]